MDAREQRGLLIAALCKITQKHGQWIVPSQTGNGTYRVNLNPQSPAVPLCTCKDFEARGEPCKHVYAVRYVSCGLATDEGGELRDAYAYWDNQYRKWGLASISHAKAFANRFTARARGIHQTVLEWKATL